MQGNWNDTERRELKKQGIDPDLLSLTLATDKNALFSVFDRPGSEAFAAYLQSEGWNIIASGGTAGYLEGHGIRVIPYAKIYGSGEMLKGRVKTIGRGKSAGFLAKPDQREELKANNWPWLEALCGNFYNVQKEIDDPASTEESIIEMADVGGPTSALEASKGRRIIVSDLEDVDSTIPWMKAGCPEDEKRRRRMAKKAYDRVKQHVSALAECFGDEDKWG